MVTSTLSYLIKNAGKASCFATSLRVQRGNGNEANSARLDKIAIRASWDPTPHNEMLTETLSFTELNAYG